MLSSFLVTLLSLKPIFFRCVCYNTWIVDKHWHWLCKDVMIFQWKSPTSTFSKTQTDIENIYQKHTLHTKYKTHWCCWCATHMLERKNDQIWGEERRKDLWASENLTIDRADVVRESHVRRHSNNANKNSILRQILNEFDLINKLWWFSAM